MPKQNLLEKAIASLDAQIEVLQLARLHLVKQRSEQKPKRATPRLTKVETDRPA